jgi:hypothetical protein
MVDLNQELLNQGILCAETNQAEVELHSLLEVGRTLSSRFGVDEVACRDPPRCLEHALYFGEENCCQPIEWIRVRGSCFQKAINAVARYWAAGNE